MSYKKIVHFADAHFKKISEYDHSKDVAKKFINDLEKLSKKYNRDELIVYFAGDLVHEFISVSNELHLALNKFLSEIVELFDVRMILGNHDIPKKHMSSRVDTISTVLDMLNDDRILLMDESKVYVDKNINWCVYNMYGDYPTIKKSENINIGCFHGIFLPDDHPLNKFTVNAIDSSNFKGCDVVLAGDIHQPLDFNFFNGEKNIEFIYANSLRQEKVDEKLDDRGYVIYDIETKTFERKIIYSDYGLVDVRINKPEDITANKVTFVNIDYNGTFPINAKFRIGVNTSPIAFSVNDFKTKIKESFKERYGVDPKNIVKIYPIFKNKKIASLTDDLKESSLIENIADINVLSKHVQEFCKQTDKKLVYDDVLFREIHNEANITDIYDVNSRFNIYELEELYIENFQCYGKVHLTKQDLLGLTSIISNPQNEAGKSTLLRAITFLFHEKVLDDSNAVMAELLNQYSKDNFFIVRGIFKLNNAIYRLQRKITVDKNFKSSQKITFEKKVGDIYVDETFSKDILRSMVGNYDDYCLTQMTTISNLEELIQYNKSKKADVLGRYVGLEYLSHKANKANENHRDWKKGTIFQKYDLKDLVNTNIDKTHKSSELEKQNEELIKKENSIKGDLSTITDQIELLEKQKKPETYFESSKEQLLKNTDKIISEGKELKTKLNTLKALEKPTNTKDLNYAIAELDLENKNLKKSLTEKLMPKLICEVCKKDYQTKLLTEDEKQKININIDSNNSKIKSIRDEINKNDKILSKINEIPNIELKIKTLYDEHARIQKQLKTYDDNQKIKSDNIIINNKIDIIKIDQLSINEKLKTISLDQSKIQGEKVILEKEILNNKNIINIIEPEIKKHQAYELYKLAMGRDGVPKMIMNDMIPIINSELSRLLDDVVDFKVTLELVDNKEYEFFYDKDDYKRRLASCSGWQKLAPSLAIKLVLGYVTALPKSNIVGFDEVLGAASEKNFENIKKVLDLGKELYDCVLLISHNDNIQNFSDNHLYVRKGEDNITEIIC